MLNKSEDIFINNLQVFYDMLNKDLGKLGFYQIIQLPNNQQKLLSISKTCCNQVGYNKKAVEDNPNIIIDIIASPYKEQYLEKRKHCLEAISSMELEIKCVLPNEIVKWFQIFATTKLLVDNSIIFNVIQTDITISKQNEEKLLKFNRELRLRNIISDQIAEQTNLLDLFNAVCNSLVNIGGYSLAVITPKPNPEDLNQKLYPITSYGCTAYIHEIEIDLNDPIQSMGPVATVLKDKKITVVNDFHDSNMTSPWHITAKKYNLASIIVIPLSFANNKNAALSVYSNRADAFDSHEIEIITMIGDSLSIAAKAIQNKTAKDQATYNLQERMKELRTIYQSNQILQNEHLHFEEKIQQIVEILPLGWQFSNDCVAKITFHDQDFFSKQYKLPVVYQRAEISSFETAIGLLEIGYCSHHEKAQEGPFLMEERKLIDALAKLIGENFEKNKAKADLLQSKANLTAIFKNTDIGYVLLNKAYQILSFNNAAKQVYAFERGIVLTEGANFIQLLPPDRRKITEDYFFKVISEQQSLEYEIMINHHQEEYFFNISIHPVIDQQKVMGLATSIQDITKKKLAELEQRKISNDLVSRNRDLEQFSYIVSHNIRAPLSNILGLKEALKIASTTEETEFLINGIGQSAEILDGVIKDVNNILHINRSVTDTKETILLQNIFTEVKMGLQDLIDQSNASIMADFTLAPNIFSIKSYFITIFHAIILNGLKFAKQNINPIIKIWSHFDDSKLVIHFSDNGLGIDLVKYGESIFGLYKRFHPQVQGKGLGLFLAKSQIQYLGGEITVTSIPQEGTEFIIYFPLA